MAKHVGKTMSISTLYIKRCKLVPTVTVLTTCNFAFTNVHAEPIYVHENQCTQISNLSSPSSLSLCVTTPLPPLPPPSKSSRSRHGITLKYATMCKVKCKQTKQIAKTYSMILRWNTWKLRCVEICTDFPAYTKKQCKKEWCLITSIKSYVFMFHLSV